MINQIKWAWQRVVRGYDDRVLWDISHLDSQIVAVATYLRDEGHGRPMGVTQKKWNKVLNTLIEGFSPEPDWKNGKELKKYIKKRKEALVLLAYYWDNLWD